MEGIIDNELLKGFDVRKKEEKLLFIYIVEQTWISLLLLLIPSVGYLQFNASNTELKILVKFSVSSLYFNSSMC